MKKLKFILIIVLCLIGCGKKDIMAYSTMNEKLEIINSFSSDRTEGKQLSKEDFTVKYNNFEIIIGEQANKVLEKLGQGTANENNNFGFIGWDIENKYKFYSHGYPADSPIIDIITKVSVVEGTSIINQMNISNIGTNRNIRIGDSFEKLVELYGEPKEKMNDNNETSYYYSLDNKELDFYFDRKLNIVRILLISI